MTPSESLSDPIHKEQRKTKTYSSFSNRFLFRNIFIGFQSQGVRLTILREEMTQVYHQLGLWMTHLVTKNIENF